MERCRRPVSSTPSSHIIQLSCRNPNMSQDIESKIHAYVEQQKRLLELELRSEQDENEITNKEEEGRSTRVLRNLQVDYLEVGLMGRTVVHFIPIVESIADKNDSETDGYTKNKKDSLFLLPAHRLTVGDEVEIVTKLSQVKQNEASMSRRNKGGVISVVTDSSISVALFENNASGANKNDKKRTKSSSTSSSGGDDESDLVGAGPLSLVPRSSAEVHKKLIKSLDRLERDGADHVFAGRVIQDIFMGESGTASTFTPTAEMVAFNQNLDSSQTDAIRFALFGKQPISLIHGPPGTGKTTTVAELIRQAIHVHKMRVLVTAPSNVAVDNVLERLVANQSTGCIKKKRGSDNELGEHKIRAVRLGHPARIQPSILRYSLESLVQNADGTEIVKDIRAEMKSHLQVAANPKSRGLERRTAYREIRSLRKEIRQREEKVVESLLANAQVVLCTNVGAASYLLDRFENSSAGKPFDLVIIDEAAQALEVSCFAPMFRGKRVVLAGDHQQLSPTIKSRHSEVQRELSKTLFERVMQRGESVSRMLGIQYRMHRSISDWASKYMYENKLQSHDSVKGRKLSHLPYVFHEDDPSNENNSLLSITKNSTLLLIDTAGCDMHESVNSAGSRYNEGEAEIVLKHVKNLIHIGMKPQDIAVITPYNGQVEILRRLLLEDYPKLEIRSVDGFQGGEREAVVLSLVRSSDRGKNGIGFLKDKRRLNVAVTRAKRQVAVICDSETVSQNMFLKDLVNWMEDNGDVHSAMEYIDEEKVILKEALPSSVLQIIDAVVESTAQEDVSSASADTIQGETENDENEKTTQHDHDMIQYGLTADEVSSAKQDLAERITIFAEISDDGEEMALYIPASHDIIQHLNVVCSKCWLDLRLGQRHGKGYQAIIIKDGTAHEAKVSNNEVEIITEKISKDIDEYAVHKQNITESVSDEKTKRNVDIQDKGGSASMNSLLSSLAKERAARRLTTEPTSQGATKIKKKTKSKKGKKLGGARPDSKAKSKQDDGMEGLDDLAFLDAQIEKVQTSHGRKIDAGGSNYKTIVNGILLMKPKPQDKKRDERAANALSSKLKQAQQSRAAKTKKK